MYAYIHYFVRLEHYWNEQMELLNKIMGDGLDWMDGWRGDTP